MMGYVWIVTQALNIALPALFLCYSSEKTFLTPYLGLVGLLLRQLSPTIGI